MKNRQTKTDRCCRCGRFVNLRMSPMLTTRAWACVHAEGEWDENGEWRCDFMCLPYMERALGRSVEEDDLMLAEDFGGKPHHVLWNEVFVERRFSKRRFPYSQTCGNFG